MKFSDNLIKEANRYRKIKLNSTDESDVTFWPNKKRNAIGGNYMCVHLRRKDFLYGRKKDVPSIEGAAEQIGKALQELGLNTVFVATDASKDGILRKIFIFLYLKKIKENKTIFSLSLIFTEKRKLKNLLDKYKILYYNPSSEIIQTYKDGGVAIIEQIICSHAR